MPGPGAAIDIAIVIAFARKCMKVFCIEDLDIKQNFSPEIAKLFIPRVAAIAATVGASIVYHFLNKVFNFFDGLRQSLHWMMQSKWFQLLVQ